MLLCTVWPHLGLQAHLRFSKNCINHRVGSNMVLFVPPSEDKWHTRPACSHHSAQRHAKISFPSVKLTLPRHGLARLPHCLQENGGTVEFTLCGPSHLGRQTHFMCSQDNTICRVCSNMCLFEPLMGTDGTQNQLVVIVLLESMQTPYV